AFSDGVEFTEKLVFPYGRRTLSEKEQGALDNAFRLIFLLAGVSYYKTRIPAKLVCQAFPLDSALAAFGERVYRAGLAEFAFRNKVHLDFTFQTVNEAQPYPVTLDLPRRPLVPIGGGKDSIVTLEILREAGFDQTLIACGGDHLAAPIAQTIQTSGLPHLHVRRTLSPKLMELNEQGALNGHVPITAILSSIVVACAILYGFDTVVLSNESSANEPNVLFNGREVNHQYSKSLTFERDFNRIVQQTISPNLTYFSLLRPMTETAIAERFAKLKAYHTVFRSCNTAFKQDEAKRGKKWCSKCPKCRFVFLALAPFISKGKLTSIFSANLFDDRRQIEGYKELCGLSAHKPFECVGEVSESAALLLHLATMAEWKDELVVKTLAPLLSEAHPHAEETFQRLLKPSAEHQIPDPYLKALRDA
ncbi:MAG: endonuclease domain-containing protein, partial [Bdellovibrionales bacterium]